MMRASEAGWLLTAIARGGVLELAADKDELLEALAAAGLVRAAPEPGPERRVLGRLREELARVAEARASGAADPALAGKERGLRSAILEISERLAESEGGTEVRRVQGGSYRGGASSHQRWALTQRGRTLLNDLGPRMLRIGDAPLADFDAQMRALRETIAWRARRAGEIAARLSSMHGDLGNARYSVPVGLSAVRAPVEDVARAFEVAFRTIRRGSSGFAPEQDAAAAECLCLAVGDVRAAAQDQVAMSFVALRSEVLIRHVPGSPEDALDAAALLTHVPRDEHDARVGLARELATSLQTRGRVIPLSFALVALAGEPQLSPHVVRTLLELDVALARDIPDASERMATAVLLGFVRNDPHAQLERWRTLRQYLARFSKEGMAVAAALLSWVALEPGEVLDDLRLASAELQKNKIAGGGAEMMTLAIKLLLSMAALAAGNEGDREEQLALGPVATAGLPRLGLQGAIATLPLAAATVTAFHRTVLDAASEWERTFHPTHSTYVFGGSGYRRSGWG
jgi:hypothetical protein